MKNIIIGLLAIIAFTLSSCSDKPEWADPEAHEKTEQLRKQYTTLIVGTWHYESISEKLTEPRTLRKRIYKADGAVALSPNKVKDRVARKGVPGQCFTVIILIAEKPHRKQVNYSGNL